MKDLKKDKDLSYEKAIKRLEEIVRLLEDGELPLEDSLTYFQEGIALSKHCRDKLAEIEFRVDYLLKEEQQQIQEDKAGAEAGLQNGDDID